MVNKQIFDKPPVSSFDKISSSDEVQYTLETGFQNVQRGQEEMSWVYRDVDEYVKDQPQIIMNSNDCHFSQIFLALRLNRVEYSEDGGVNQVEIDGAEYEDYDRMGGIRKIQPQRGIYSPAYLSYASNVAGELVINLQNNLNMPPSQLGRIYTFSYMLAFTTSNNQYEEEKSTFTFKLKLYDEWEFEQCTLPFVTYFVASEQFFDIECLVLGINEMNEFCSAGEGESSIVREQLIYKSSIARSDESASDSEFRNPKQDSLPYWTIQINDEETSLYGTWKFSLNYEDEGIQDCAIVAIRHPCDGETPFQVQYSGIDIQFEGGANQSSRIIADETITYEDFLSKELPSTTFTLSEYVAVGHNINSSKCSSSLFEFKSVGGRYAPTADDVFQKSTDVETLVDLQNNQVLVVEAQPNLNQGLYSAIFEMNLKHYVNNGAHNAALLYYDVTYDFPCLVDTKQTLDFYSTFDIESSFEINLDGRSLQYTHLKELIRDDLFIQKYDENKVCPAPFIGLQLVHVNKENSGNYLNAANFYGEIITAEDGQQSRDGPYPIEMLPNHDILMKATSTNGDIVGTYSFKIYVTSAQGLYQDPYFVEFPELLTINVSGETSYDFNFNEIVNLVANSLPPVQDEIVIQITGDNKPEKEVYLDSIVTDLGQEPYPDYRISVRASDAQFDSVISFVQSQGKIQLGPFPYHLVKYAISMEITVNIANEEQYESINFNVLFDKQISTADNDESEIAEQETEDEIKDVTEDSEQEDVAEDAFVPVGSKLEAQYTVQQGSKLHIDVAPLLEKTQDFIGINLLELSGVSQINLINKTLQISPTLKTEARDDYYAVILIKDGEQFSNKVILIKVTTFEIKEEDDIPIIVKIPDEEKTTIIEKKLEEKIDEVIQKHSMDIEKVETDNIQAYLEESNQLGSRFRQSLFDKIIEIKSGSLQEKEESSEPQITSDIVQPDGQFSLFFSEELLGLAYMQQISVDIQMKGQVSDLYADEEGPVNTNSFFGDDAIEIQRLRTLIAANEEEIEIFDLANYLKFELRRGDDDSAPPEDLKFSVSVKEIKSDEISFKFDFENPNKVSTGSINDMLVAEISNESFFTKLDEPQSAKKGDQVQLWLPKLLSEDNFEKVVDEIHKVVDSSANTLVASNILITLFLAISLKSMWNLLNVTQVVAYMRYFAPWPAQIDQVLEQLYDAITLRPFTEPIFEYGKSQFKIAKEKNKDAYLRSQGVESSNIFSDLGIYVIVLAIIIAILVIYQLIRFCAMKFNCCNKIIDKLRKYLFYRAPIRYIVVSYLRVLSLFATLCIVTIKVEDDVGYLVMYIILTLGLILWPVWVIGFLLKNNSKLADKKFKDKFEAAYQGIKTTSFQAIIYNAVFAVRRFDIILENLLLNQDCPLTGVTRTHYLEKIFIFLLIQTCYLGYIHICQPHDKPQFNSAEFVNEYALSAFVYTMLLFVGLNNPIGDSQEKFGKIFAILLIFFIFCYNMFVMVRITFHKIQLQCKKCKGQKKPQKKNTKPGFGNLLWSSMFRSSVKTSANELPDINDESKEVMRNLKKLNVESSKTFECYTDSNGKKQIQFDVSNVDSLRKKATVVYKKTDEAELCGIEIVPNNYQVDDYFPTKQVLGNEKVQESDDSDIEQPKSALLIVPSLATKAGGANSQLILSTNLFQPNKSLFNDEEQQNFDQSYDQAAISQIPPTNIVEHFSDNGMEIVEEKRQIQTHQLNKMEQNLLLVTQAQLMADLNDEDSLENLSQEIVEEKLKTTLPKTRHIKQMGGTTKQLSLQSNSMQTIELANDAGSRHRRVTLAPVMEQDDNNNQNLLTFQAGVATTNPEKNNLFFMSVTNSSKADSTEMNKRYNTPPAQRSQFLANKKDSGNIESPPKSPKSANDEDREIPQIQLSPLSYLSGDEDSSANSIKFDNFGRASRQRQSHMRDSSDDLPSLENEELKDGETAGHRNLKYVL